MGIFGGLIGVLCGKWLFGGGTLGAAGMSFFMGVGIGDGVSLFVRRIRETSAKAFLMVSPFKMVGIFDFAGFFRICTISVTACSIASRSV